jgi:hypothetical protein
MAGTTTPAPAGTDTAGEVARLAAKRDKWKNAASVMTTERDAARKRAKDLEDELAALKASPHAKQIADLKQQLRDVRHGQVIKDLATERKVKPEAMEDLIKLMDYKAELDEPDPEALAALIDEQRKARPYLFGEAGTSNPGPTPGDTEAPIVPGKKPVPGAGRGAAHDTTRSGVILTKAQRMDPKFMLDPKNKDLIASAAKEHRLGD